MIPVWSYYLSVCLYGNITSWAQQRITGFWYICKSYQRKHKFYYIKDYFGHFCFSTSTSSHMKKQKKNLFFFIFVLSFYFSFWDFTIQTTQIKAKRFMFLKHFGSLLLHSFITFLIRFSPFTFAFSMVKKICSVKAYRRQFWKLKCVDSKAEPADQWDQLTLFKFISYWNHFTNCHENTFFHY